MTEEYRIIVGHENYSVSNLGNVKNNMTQCIIKQRKHTGGCYCIVDLRKDKIRKTCTIHRLVALAFIEPIQDKPIVDHIDNNPSNNNVFNLRWGSLSNNQHNRKMSKNNTSGFKGVRFMKGVKKWRAEITINDVQIHLGEFLNKDDAIACRIKRANDEFGDFVNVCEKIIKLNNNNLYDNLINHVFNLKLIVIQ